MIVKTVELFESFSEADLEYLEFLPEELENIESELYPDLESISFEDVAEDMEAYLENKRKKPKDSQQNRRDQQNRRGGVKIRQGDEMRNCPKQISKEVYQQARTTIKQLTRDKYADIWIKKSNICKTKEVRIDVQGSTSNDFQNLQAQLNDQSGNSTIATVLVAQALSKSSIKIEQQSEVMNKVRLAFGKSLISYRRNKPRIWIVEGTFTNK